MTNGGELKMVREIVKKDTVFFKGSVGITNPATRELSESKDDWHGFYLGTTKEQSVGYLSDATCEVDVPAEASLWKCVTKKDLQQLHFFGGSLEKSDVSGEIKAREIKDLLHEEGIIKEADKTKPLTKIIGEKSYIYRGKDGDGHDDEIIIPFKMMEDSDEFLEFSILEKYEVTNGVAKISSDQEKENQNSNYWRSRFPSNKSGIGKKFEDEGRS